MKYWIVGEVENKKLLTDLGIKLPKYSKSYGQWENVEISEDQFHAMGKYWGTFFWGRPGEMLDTVQDKNKT